VPHPDRLRSASDAASAFDFGPAAGLSVAALGSGLIHDSFLVSSAGQPIAVLQCINRHVFTEPRRIMENLRTVLDHARAHGDRSTLRFPAIITTRDGADLHIAADGECWRAQEYLRNTRSLVSINLPEQARALGRALGEFHRLLADLPGNRLVPTLRGFHETPRYLEQFDAVNSTSRADPGEGVDCIDFIDTRRELVQVLQDARSSGRLPLRTVHGDPKVDNFLFDTDAQRVVSLIDLDTVQAGLLHYDIGDCLRSCCNPAGEDPARLEDAVFDLALCRSWLAGYMQVMAASLDDDEIELIYPALCLLPLELGMRFFNDHRNGDRYFRVSGRGQNLRRARVQFRLVAQIEAAEEELRSLIATCVG